ncbi:MAG: hypothetical protein JSW05_02270 [Candidatus Thorarchaeota archaeon]|nr:MAG: hypothetical protein JSW05_02270 [Candidatus Thorarchaeota archaeon]
MTVGLKQEGAQALERNLWAVGILFALVALLAPHTVVYYMWDLQVMAATWMAFIDPYSVSWMSNPFLLMVAIPGALLRLVFGYMVVRAYQGKTTKKRAIIIGIALELQGPVFFYVPVILFQLASPILRSYYPILLPIPALLILGLVIMRIWPPPTESTTWTDNDTQGHWWESSTETAG